MTCRATTQRRTAGAASSTQDTCCSRNAGTDRWIAARSRSSTTGSWGPTDAARRPGRDPNTRAEPPSPSRSFSRRPGGRGTRDGGSGTLATPRPCAHAGASNAKSTSQRRRALCQRGASPKGRACPRRSRRHPPSAAGPSGPAPARDSTLRRRNTRRPTAWFPTSTARWPSRQSRYRATAPRGAGPRRSSGGWPTRVLPDHG